MKYVEDIKLQPGYKAWISGATRQVSQDANRAAGLPCYCASLWSGFCDFCTGMSPLDGERAAGMLKEQEQVRP